jgi:predicted RNA-binding protein with TRAM domain
LDQKKDKRSPPVHVGDVVYVECINTSEKDPNTAVCRMEGGFVIFTAGAKNGERVQAKVDSIHPAGRCAFGTRV